MRETATYLDIFHTNLIAEIESHYAAIKRQKLSETFSRRKNPITIFTDLNGTVGFNQFDPENAHVYSALIGKGISVIPTTQNSLHKALKFFKELPKPPIIICEGGNTIGIQHCCSDAVDQMIKQFTKTKSEEEYDHFLIGFPAAYLQEKIRHSPKLKQHPPTKMAPLESCQSLTQINYQNEAELRQLINESKNLGIEIFPTTKNSAIICSDSSSKGKTVNLLKEACVFPESSITIAIGNDKNDISMMQAVDIPLFIKNDNISVTSLPPQTHYLRSHTDWKILKIFS